METDRVVLPAAALMDVVPQLPPFASLRRCRNGFIVRCRSRWRFGASEQVGSKVKRVGFVHLIALSAPRDVIFRHHAGRTTSAALCMHSTQLIGREVPPPPSPSTLRISIITWVFMPLSGFMAALLMALWKLLLFELQFLNWWIVTRRWVVELFDRDAAPSAV